MKIVPNGPALRRKVKEASSESIHFLVNAGLLAIKAIWRGRVGLSRHTSPQEVAA
jgi:hypothetical protein